MDEGFPRYLRKDCGKMRGTQHEIDQLCKHIKRRDYQDPFGPYEMSFVKRTAAASYRGKVLQKLSPSSIKNLEELCRGRGTNTGESTNKQINYSVQNATRMRQCLCEAKVALRVHSHNLKKDILFGNMTGREAKPIIWFLQLANDQIADSIPFLQKKKPPINKNGNRIKYSIHQLWLKGSLWDWSSCTTKITCRNWIWTIWGAVLRGERTAPPADDFGDDSWVIDFIESNQDDAAIAAATANEQEGSAMAATTDEKDPSTPSPPKKARYPNSVEPQPTTERKGTGITYHQPE